MGKLTQSSDHTGHLLVGYVDGDFRVGLLLLLEHAAQELKRAFPYNDVVVDQVLDEDGDDLRRKRVVVTR